MFIPRAIEHDLIKLLAESQKAVILYGPRQVGKTTLVHLIERGENYREKTLTVNGDERKYVDILSSQDLQKLKGLVHGYKLLIIDEAQKIPEIGTNIKILVDNLPELKIIATGSSSFDLAHKVKESMTGRAWDFILYPIAIMELRTMYNEFELRYQLEERLLYGSYPEVFQYESNEEKQRYLRQICDSYLYKDIFELATIKHPTKIRDLLKLLAFQIGNEVSLAELSNTLGVGINTVEHYINLLEKSFIIFRLKGLSRKLRKEVTKMDKIYFYDLGVRNEIINNFNSLKDRNDVGQLWENFLISERTKWLRYNNKQVMQYFWRTYTGAEVDYIEEREGLFYGYEFKWGSKRVKEPKGWLQTYKSAKFEVINQENFLSFI